MQMLNFCTLFDSNYFLRGMAMYQSLLRTCPDFHLYIFAFDDKAYHALKKFDLKKITLISLEEFEDPQLLAVKSSRNIAEYCWTCTSSTILYCIKKYKLDHCTYIDADLYFFNNPQVLVNEMGNKDVLITEHRYSQETKETELAGKYCVQFITFKNTEKGMRVLQWWRNACIDWCYARDVDGKFGDQKYLDDWTTRFEGVHVLQNIGGGLAPWNVQQYVVSKENNSLFVTEEKTEIHVPVVFYHFHYLKFYKMNVADLGVYKYSKVVLELIYRPYIKAIEEAHKSLQKDNISVPYKIEKGSFHFLRMVLLIFRRKLKGQDVYFINKLIK
jgi:hypothetical protein